MKKISDATIDRLKTISPATLVNKQIIKTAPNFRESKQQGYCCPLCGSGERGGTGAGTFDASNKFFCHSCKNADVGGHKLSTIDLYAIARHLEGESFSEKCSAMASEFGGGIDYDESDLPRRKRRTKTPPKPPKTPLDPAELELIRADLATSDEPLIKFVESCGGTWRGFNADFMIRHGLKMKADWTPTKSRVAKKFATPTARILIPAGEDFYVARFCGNLDDYDGSTREFVEKNQKLNAGSPKLFLSKQDVFDSDEPIFAAEGALDALSIAFAGYGAVALNGRGNGDLLVDALKLRQAEKEKMPLVIVLMDSDDAGRKAAPTLYDELVNIGCPCCVRFLFDDVTKTDANDILVANGVDNLRDRLADIQIGALAELDACAVELKRRKQQRLDDDSLNSLFQGDTSDLDFARRIETFCGDRVRWVKDDKTWLLYESNEHGGGLWHDVGDKNSALLPCTREMSDVMTEFAENKDERELAEKMKSTRKVLASITMLKGLDSLLVTSKDLDTHAELICCLNGVVDLQTGKLLDADPKTFLMTRTVNAVFGEPRKENLQFVQNFFAQIMPDEMTRAGLTRWLGYCMSGETSAEKFMVWIGESGSNGKGTLGGTLLELFGGYGVGLQPRALLKSNRPIDADKATTALNGLDGRRFALSEEMPLDGEMDSSLVKNLSGGDRINLRLNFKEFKTLINHAKLNISGNFTPRLENTQDGGIRRRLLNMPFTEQFTGDRADPTLKKKLLLQDNLNALFYILVREAADWYRDGLIISDLMTQATQQHLNDSDFVADFLSDNYEFGEDLSVKVKDLIDDLKLKYPAECKPFRKRADLINLVASFDGVTLDYDYHGKVKVFKGIDKPKPNQGDSDNKNEKSDGFIGEPILSSDNFCPPPN